jgi:sugar (pentulose or hexulose) kinase
VKPALSTLACDIGAGSGRIIECSYNGNCIDFRQVTRFANGPIKVGNGLYWDILGIYRDIKEGLVKVAGLGIKAVSMGMDTWGNDFAFIDKNGIMTENPHSYRDNRTKDIIPFVRSVIPDFDLYMKRYPTGKNEYLLPIGFPCKRPFRGFGERQGYHVHSRYS